jgi:hypothetical protein
MQLLTPALVAALRGNAKSLDRDTRDPIPLVKLFNPVGAATWLATELDADEGTLFGLADLGFGCPELGSFSLAELRSVRLPFGLGIERDLFFETDRPLSVWAQAARLTGSIPKAEAFLARTRRASFELPPSAPDGG